jgi:glyoxylase-like metal-dependent hydrolase (beta-lactamase superfamily II)
MIDLQVIPVTASIWCVRRPSYLTCSYIVDTGDGLVLVDAGMDSDGRDMLGAFGQIGKDPRDVRAILLTHWHNDHSAGAHVLKELSGALVCYHKADAPQFTRQTAHPGLRGWVSDRIPEWGVFVLAKGLLGESAPRAVDADTWADEGAPILGEFEVVETPGHTPGHISFFHRPTRALFAGDALAVIGGKVHFMAGAVTPDKPNARESMLRCLALEPDILCPGHREPLTENVAERCREMAAYIRSGGRWPLLG